MTASTNQPQQSMQALANAVVTQTDYAVMGATMANGGINGAEVSNFIGLVERMAADSGKAVATALVPILTKLLQDTHQAACLEIMRRLQIHNRNKWASHEECARVAWEVAQSRPSHVVPTYTEPPR